MSCAAGFIISTLILIGDLSSFLEATSICERYGLRGACDLLPSGQSTTPQPIKTGSDYCDQACKEDNAFMYIGVCPCASKPTTEPPCQTSYLEQLVCGADDTPCVKRSRIRKVIAKCRETMRLLNSLRASIETCDCPLKQTQLPDVCDRPEEEASLCLSLNRVDMLPAGTECYCLGPTSPLPPLQNACYYSLKRDATFISRRKRIFSGTPANPDCEYPGIVGIFSEVDTPKQRSICTATLVDEQTILISKNCAARLRAGMYVHVNSYKTQDVTKDIEIDVTTLTDVIGIHDSELSFVQLKQSVVFDEKCALPACLPNNLFATNGLDLDNCRIVGFGNTDDNFPGVQPTQLHQVEVKVDSTSLTKAELTVTRKDNMPNVACFEDDSAPVMCPIQETGEWTVVAVNTEIAFPCSSGNVVKSKYTNILKEAPTGPLYYFKTLSETKYAKESAFNSR